MEKVIAMCIEAYIKVYGLEKWNSLTEEQIHQIYYGNVFEFMTKNLPSGVKK